MHCILLLPMMFITPPPCFFTATTLPTHVPVYILSTSVLSQSVSTCALILAASSHCPLCNLNIHALRIHKPIQAHQQSNYNTLPCMEELMKT